MNLKYLKDVKISVVVTAWACVVVHMDSVSTVQPRILLNDNKLHIDVPNNSHVARVRSAKFQTFQFYPRKHLFSYTCDNLLQDPSGIVSSYQTSKAAHLVHLPCLYIASVKFRILFYIAFCLFLLVLELLSSYIVLGQLSHFLC